MCDIKVYKLSPEAIIPFKGSELSACYDVCACFHVEGIKYHGMSQKVKVEAYGTPGAFIRLYPNDMALIPTGLIFCLPVGHHLKIYSRSGSVLKRFLVVANQPGVIDADYTKESFVMLHNRSEYVQLIKTGDAIAQCEICENITTDFSECNEVYYDSHIRVISYISSRDGGFGSTDDKLKN